MGVVLCGVVLSVGYVVLGLCCVGVVLCCLVCDGLCCIRVVFCRGCVWAIVLHRGCVV